MKSFNTPKGTELPILNLRGKDYLEVKYRLVWFNEEKPTWSIETEAVDVTPTSAYFKATIRDESGRIRATAHKFENKQGFGDFIEKAETGSIGRALAMIGFGTQFCGDELDEGERIVDSPVTARLNGQQRAQNLRSAMTGPEIEPPDDIEPFDSPGDPGDVVINIGRQFRGKKFSEVPKDRLQKYCDWLLGEAERNGGKPSASTQAFLNDAFRYLGLG